MPRRRYGMVQRGRGREHRRGYRDHHRNVEHYEKITFKWKKPVVHFDRSVANYSTDSNSSASELPMHWRRKKVHFDRFISSRSPSLILSESDFPTCSTCISSTTSSLDSDLSTLSNDFSSDDFVYVDGSCAAHRRNNRLSNSYMVNCYKNEDGDDEGCQSYRMNLLISTVFSDATLSDSDAWTAVASWYSKQDAPLARYINELTLQINESRVRPGDYIKGRIIVDVAKPVDLTQLVLHLNRTFVHINETGRLSELNGMNSQKLILLEDRRDQRIRARMLDHREFEVNSDQVMDKKIRLPPGRQAMRFCIRVPEDEFNSFTYVAPTDGSTIINHYSIETTARMNGITESTNRLTFHVHSVNDFEGTIGLVDSNNFVCILRKFVRRTDGLSFALAQTSDGYYPQYESIEALVLRRMRIPLTGEEKEERVTPTITLLPQSSPADSSVVGEYRKKTHDANVPLEFTQYFERMDLKLPPLLPSVWCEDFMCDYYLRIYADGTTYEAPFAIIENFVPNAHNHCLNPETANATSFKIVGQQF